MKFLIWYEANYLNEDTDVIVMLPERDVRYLLQPEVAQPGGSAADAVANFKILIGRILDLFGDRLVGIYAVDEPELFGRAEYFNLETLPALRLAIREAEREWRETPGKDPDFLELTETEREAGLLPVLLTFSAEAFAIRLKIKSKDASFSFRKVREFADIFLYDEYPYKRQSSSEPSPFNLREELLAGTSLTEAEVDQVLTNSVLTTLFQDPVRVLSNFDLMRQELNEKPNRDGIFGIANPQYRHAGAWIQGNGSPFDHGTVESWSTTPAPNPGFIEGRDVDGVEVLQVAAPRGRRLPTADEIRFFT